MSYRVLIVDDQIVPRQLFESIVQSSPSYDVLATVASAKVADIYCASGKVDLVLMDIVMSDGSNGLDAAARIKHSYPRTKVIIVTSMPDPMFLRRAREIGVDSFWYKEVQRLPLLELMDRTMAGERVFPDSPPSVDIGLTTSVDITEREVDVLRLLAEGLTDKEIAERLYLSVSAVRYHVNNLITKTGFSSRTELAVNAVRRGIVVPGISED